MASDSLHARRFERILLIKPSAFGDVLHTLPVLVKLRVRYPAARIDWLVTPENAELVRYHPDLSNVLLFARRGRSAIAGLARLLRELPRQRLRSGHRFARATPFGAVHASNPCAGTPRLRPAAFPAAAQRVARNPLACTAGTAREASWLAYTHRIAIPTLNVHAVDRYLWLGHLLGLDDGLPDLRVYWPALADEHVDQLLAKNGLPRQGYAIVVPTTIWETKHWHVPGFAAVGRFLQQQGFPVIVAGRRAMNSAVRRWPRPVRGRSAWPGKRRSPSSPP